MFRVPCSVLRVPCSMFRVLCSVFHVTCAVFRAPCSVPCSMFHVQRFVPCSVFHVAHFRRQLHWYARVVFFVLTFTVDGSEKAPAMMQVIGKGTLNLPKRNLEQHLFCCSSCSLVLLVLYNQLPRYLSCGCRQCGLQTRRCYPCVHFTT